MRILSTVLSILFFISACSHLQTPSHKVQKEVHKGVHFVKIKSSVNSTDLMEVALLYQYSECKKLENYSQLISSKINGNTIEQAFVCNQLNKENREAQDALEVIFCKRNKSEINKEFCQKILDV